MSTISQNNIVVNYVITSDQIAKTKNEFDKLTDAEKKAVDETKKLNDSLKKTGQEGSQSVKNVGNEMNNLSGIVKSGAGLLAGYFSVSALLAFKDRLVETTIKFQGYSKAIEFGSGSAANFARNQQFLNDLINKYGLGLASTTEAYKSFFNASTLAGQSQQETNRQFEAVTKAGTVLKLTTDQMQGAFLALGQMMSKGTVQSEELRQQLGERIPGAITIMARALGVSEIKLNKMLEQGQVLSKDFLPKFASQLEKDLGGGAEAAANSTQAALNRMKNSYDEFLLYVGQKLTPAVLALTKIFQGYTYALRGAAGERERAAREQGAEYTKEIVKGLEKIEGLNARSDAALEKRNFFQKREFQTQQEINKLLAERDELLSRPRKAGTAISGRLNEIEKEIQALAGNKYMYQEITSSLKEYENELSQQNKSLFQNTEETNANTKSKEKQLGEYDKLVQSASLLEKALQDLYATGVLANTPLEIKLRTVLAQIDMINERVRQAKEGFDKMETTSGTEKGGTPKAFTEAITAFGKPSQNKLAIDQIVENAKKANDEFDKIEEERTRKFKEEQEKRKAAEEEFYNKLPQFASQAISIISQYQNQAAEYELQVLNEKLAAKQISDKEYEKERRKILTKQAQDQKAAAILQATIDIAGSIMSTLKQFGGTPYGIAMAAITAGLGAAQLAVIQSQKIPKFKKGTDYVSLNGNPKGEDTIPALLNEGEAIIRTEENAKYPGLAKAWNDGKLDEHIYSKWITPELILKKSIEREAIDYDKLGQSVADSIKKNPQVKVSFDKSGFATYIIKGSSVINYQNNRYSSK